MKDAELRGKLLKHFYDLCDKNGGWVPVTEIIVAPDLVSPRGDRERVSAPSRGGPGSMGTFHPRVGAIRPGKAKITGSGVDVVTGSRRSTLDVRFPEAEPLAAPITTAAVKESERINLAEGLAVLANYLPAADAKGPLARRFIRKAFSQWPCFAFSYDEAEIEWATRAVRIPRRREPFIPTFSRTEFNDYFLETRPLSHVAWSDRMVAPANPSNISLPKPKPRRKTERRRPAKSPNRGLDGFVRRVAVADGEFPPPKLTTKDTVTRAARAPPACRGHSRGNLLRRKLIAAEPSPVNVGA
jgi:hypothetical protein